ncbi:MAG: bifunctional oligoribonuclease/PAP phosphatase NrnA [Phycisphaerae bacterium]|nr:bifunctional oligoribonuclease/PAP phosphatase NrnA [Phycisphaerae bacterium]
MIRTDDFQKAVELVNKSESILITAHDKPDGDACGSIVALCESLRAQGKNVRPLLLSALPGWYQFIPAEQIPILDDDLQAEELMEGRFGEFDLIIIVDTNSCSQLPKFEEYLKSSTAPVLILDHHVTGDGLGDVELTDTTAAATGLIVLDLLKYAGWEMTEKIAEALFVATATDTGWFQFSNTDSRVHRACGEFIDAGAKPTRIYDNLYHNFSHARFKLMAAMLGSLELHFDGRYAAMHVSQRDFERTGAGYSDTENLINECHRIGTVKASALFVELKDGRIRCSLRSRGSMEVNVIAAGFGGGGHRMAAGTYLPGPLENAKRLILDEITQELR